MQLIYRVSVLMMGLLLLAGCGGGGGVSANSISASPTSVTFNATQGAAPPAPQTVHIHFVGAGVVAGYAPGVPVPSWLQVSQQGSASGNDVDFALSVTDTATSGTRNTSVRFATGNAALGDVKTVDVPVTYTVAVPFDATATATSLAFTALARSTSFVPAAGYPLTIKGSQARWRVTASAPWLKLSTASGTGEGTVTVTVDASAVAAGSFTGDVTVTDDDSGGTRTFPATLVTRSPGLVTTPSAVSFRVVDGTPVSGLQQTLLVSDELNGAVPSEASSWTLQSVSVPWLQATPTSGSSAPPQSITLSLNTTELAKLAGGSYTASVTLAYQRADGGAQTLAIPVTLAYQLPQVSFVGSYIALAGQPGSIYVRGSNFTSGDHPITVRLGTTDFPNLTPDGDTQIRLSYPALAAGRYPVSIPNALGIPASTADLLVLSPSAMTYQALSAPSVRKRLVYDAGRTTLYALNTVDQEIEVYAFASGTWSAASPFVVPNLTDIALAPSGRSLIVLSQQAVNELALPIGSATLQTRASNPSAFCGQFLAALAMANDGKAYIITNLAGCSGFTNAYRYDMNTHAIQSLDFFYAGTIGGSADGSTIFAGSKGVSPPQGVTIFNTLSGVGVQSQSVTYNLEDVSVSGDASRVALNTVDVYNASLTLLGHLPQNGKVLLSRNSALAYVYRDDGTTTQVDIYDLNGALGAGAIYPLFKTITLADRPDAGQGYTNIAMAETPDGSTLFISGDSKIIVQPLN